MTVDPIIAGCRNRASGASVDLVIPEDLHYFRGHFPGMPIVPGVVQIKWAISIAHACLGVAPAIRGMEALKFQQVLRPGESVVLDLEYAEAAGKLRFAFASGLARYSSGRLLLRALP